MKSTGDARKLAAAWAALEDDHKRNSALEACFKHATPAQLVDMWSSGLNLAGRKLSSFEFAALIEAWCRVFGTPPPDDDQAEVEVVEVSPSEPELDDDQMLRTRDVVKLTGLSLSTLKRMIAAGHFPKATRLSPRRNGWKTSVVRAWLRGFDDDARRTKH